MEDISVYDENALINLGLLRDYTGDKDREKNFTDEDKMEIDRLWKMTPPGLFEAAKKWEVDIYELLHKAAHAWVRIQSDPNPLILGIKKGRVWLDITLQKESDKEERIDLRLYYMAGYTFFETLAIIARHLR